jgi:hypothetical protein
VEVEVEYNNEEDELKYKQFEVDGDESSKSYVEVEVEYNNEEDE